MSAAKKTSSAPTLADLRCLIAEIKQDIQEVDNAGLPAKDCEAALLQCLGKATTAFDALKRRAAECLAAGELPTLQYLTGHPVGPNAPAQLALGAAVASYGADRILAEARQAAAKMAGTDGLRLTFADRQEKLHSLRCQLYKCELDEEALIMATGEARRLDANPAAILGIPLAFADEAGLLAKGL